MTEEELQDAVIDHLRTAGYLVHHDRPAQRGDGSWYTAVQGDAGFPDILAIHPKTGFMIVVELKSEKGVVSEAQLEWLNAFRNHGCLEGMVGVWKPDAWPKRVSYWVVAGRKGLLESPQIDP